MKPCSQMLREYREDRGVTQAHVSRKAGMRAQRLSALETGGIRLTADELVKICLKGYGVTPADFFASVFSKNEENKIGGEHFENQ